MLITCFTSDLSLVMQHLLMMRMRASKIYVSMYQCINVSMHLCIYLTMYVCMYVSIYIYVRMYVCMYVCMYLSIYKYVRTYVCMYVCMYVSINLPIYSYIYPSICWDLMLEKLSKSLSKIMIAAEGVESKYSTSLKHQE